LAIGESTDVVIEWARAGVKGYVVAFFSGMAELVESLRYAARGDAYCTPAHHVDRAAAVGSQYGPQ